VLSKVYIVKSVEDINLLCHKDFYMVIDDIKEKHRCKSNIIYLVDLIPEDIELGKQFLLSYNIMLNIQKLLMRINNIHEIVFYRCKYLDVYFTMQYIRYSGLGLENIKIICNQCNDYQMQKGAYRFPDYWIEKVESECKEFINQQWNKVELRIRKNKPLLSIIIPYYNLGKYLDETVQSIKSCSYDNYEILIINDGTHDEYSIEVLNKYRGDNKVRIIDQENKGLSAARNIGVYEANGEYITFLDADDLITSSYYERAISILEYYDDIDIVYSWVQFFENKHEIWPTFNLSLPYLLLSNMSAAFYVIRKEKFLNYGMNKDEMKHGMEDYESLIRMHVNGCKGIAIPEALVKYRYRIGSMSKSFNPEIVIEIYNTIVEYHKEVYLDYGIEIIKLINANGPGYLWNNPTKSYPSVCLNANEDINDIKYILIRLANSKIGKKVIRILKKYKTLKENR